MNKEFAPYEPSLNLKELGFNEPCFAWYDGRYPSSINQDYCKNSEEWLNTIHCATPTFSQAFRFFREKYNLDSFVKHLYKSTIKVGYYFGIDEYKGIQFQMGLDTWYNTYEEAELACLKKLIEIVKQNSN
jgi:hypothetical protein